MTAIERPFGAYQRKKQNAQRQVAEKEFSRITATTRGADIRQRRERLGLSTRELAEAAGINQASVSNVENEKTFGVAYDKIVLTLRRLETERQGAGVAAG